MIIPLKFYQFNPKIMNTLIHKQSKAILKNYVRVKNVEMKSKVLVFIIMKDFVKVLESSKKQNLSCAKSVESH